MRIDTQKYYTQAEGHLIALSKISSVTPPSDTRAITAYVREFLETIPGITLEMPAEVESTPNIVASMTGLGDGGQRRLLLNGHLDTFEVVSPEKWTHSPFGGEVVNRRLFGVGVSDMKAGCASLLTCFSWMATHRSLWSGELTLTLVGWEEAGGKHGTDFLLRTMPDLKNVDAALIGDVGSARVVRFAEKGRYRFKLMAQGVPGHGAHMHKTRNAADILIDAITEYKNEIAKIRPACPQNILDAVKKAAPVSESVSGTGETKVLLNITNNIGILRAGTAPNLVPGYAEAVMDTRLPIGVSPNQIEAVLDDLISLHPDISYQTQMICEPLYSDPDHPLVRLLVANAEKSFKEPCAATVRVGGTDAKHLRRYGIPSYSCGVEGGNMGAPDEFVDLDELDHLVDIHLQSCYDYLQ